MHPATIGSRVGVGLLTILDGDRHCVASERGLVADWCCACCACCRKCRFGFEAAKSLTRLATAFARGPALVTFVTAGDGPTSAILNALVAGGADVVELGMPFTDPMADGPAIQAANLRSLTAGTTTADILSLARDFRARHRQVPLVLMGYANPMVRRGPEWFAAQCKDAGVDGVICVDLPPEEDELAAPLRAAGVEGGVQAGVVVGSGAVRLPEDV